METQTPKSDLLGLLEDNLKIWEQLESLERDTGAWDRRREMNDLESITALIRKLEADISQTMSDFTSLTGDQPFPEEFHHAFSIMSDLFGDLKRMKEELEQSYLQPGELHRLEINWAKLEKTFEALKRQINIVQ